MIPQTNYTNSNRGTLQMALDVNSPQPRGTENIGSISGKTFTVTAVDAPRVPRMTRGKWDFSSDEMKLKAHLAIADSEVYEQGWEQGHKAGVASKNDWSPSIACAIIVSVMTISAAAVVIMRPDLFRYEQPIGPQLGSCVSWDCMPKRLPPSIPSHLMEHTHP